MVRGGEGEVERKAKAGLKAPWSEPLEPSPTKGSHTVTVTQEAKAVHLSSRRHSNAGEVRHQNITGRDTVENEILCRRGYLQVNAFSKCGLYPKVSHFLSRYT